MRSKLVAGAALLSGLMLAIGTVWEPASAADGQAAPTPFLVLNVQKVFADYKKFQASSENLKAQLESKEKQLMDMEQQIKAKADSIPSIQNQGDRDNVQKEIQELKFDFEKTRRDARQEFLTAEADMYATVYAEMFDLVKAYCDKYSYFLVLRVQDPDFKDKSTPNKILQTLNREVIYSHSNLDLTKTIIDALNQKFEQAQGGRAPATR